MDRDDPRVSRTPGPDPRHLGRPHWPRQEEVQHLEFVSHSATCPIHVDF